MVMKKKVIRNLLGNKYPKVREEVEKVMGGNVMEFEAKIIKNQGREEGRQETIKESLKVLITMLKNSNVDVETVYRIVKANELYKEVTYEQIEKYYGQMPE